MNQECTTGWKTSLNENNDTIDFHRIPMNCETLESNNVKKDSEDIQSFTSDELVDIITD